jgi:glutamine synthetase
LEKTDNFDEEVHNIICEFLKEHKRIIFNGNGYADEWVEEAELRGLPNLRTTIDAIPALITDKAIDVFGKFGVLSKEELESRAEIKYEEYSKLINIEALTMVDMAKKQILPAVMRYEAELANGANAIKTAGVTPSVQLDMLNSINEKLVVLEKAIGELEQADKDAQAIPEGREQAKAYCNKVIPAMDAVRKPADELEFLVDKEAWPFPSYGDLLFYK